jgi:GLPGLI family protein
MKPMFFFLTFLVFPLEFKAQSNYKIVYGEVFKIVSFSKQRNLEDYDRKHFVYTNGDSVGFCSFGLQKRNNKNNTVGGKKDHHAMFIFPGLNRLLSENHFVKPYNLSEHIPFNYNWHVQTDTMRIAGYLCRAAVSDGIVAWFAVDIPLPFGPSSFNGLPGLILMVEDHRNRRICRAISVTTESAKIVLPDLRLRACENCESKLDVIRKYFAD